MIYFSTVIAFSLSKLTWNWSVENSLENFCGIQDSDPPQEKCLLSIFGLESIFGLSRLCITVGWVLVTHCSLFTVHCSFCLA